MFHWHIVDSQSFPLVVPNYIEIARQGAYSPDEVYTPLDVAHIVSYAAEVRFSRLLAKRPKNVISMESSYSAESTFSS
jgi:Glycosyl hydrolase family 20, catalytic domain